MDKDMQKGQKEARYGLDSEKNIVALINTNKLFSNSVKSCLNKLGFVIEGEIKARLNNVKTDIFIEDNSSKIGVSIKTITKTSFHQVDRRKLQLWKELLDMPEDIFVILREAIMRIARNPRDYFILQKDRESITDFFENHVDNIINEIFIRGEQDLKLLMVCDRIKNKLYLFRMEEVANFLTMDIRNNINFSSKGILKFGNFMTVQRKSGNGRRIIIPKTDLNHPGNQLQFKFSPIKFAESVEETKPINFQIIILGK